MLTLPQTPGISLGDPPLSEPQFFYLYKGSPGKQEVPRHFVKCKILCGGEGTVMSPPWRYHGDTEAKSLRGPWGDKHLEAGQASTPQQGASQMGSRGDIRGPRSYPALLQGKAVAQQGLPIQVGKGMLPRIPVHVIGGHTEPREGEGLVQSHTSPGRVTETLPWVELSPLPGEICLTEAPAGLGSNPHFIDEDTKSQGDETFCPNSLSGQQRN